MRFGFNVERGARFVGNGYNGWILNYIRMI